MYRNSLMTFFLIFGTSSLSMGWRTRPPKLTLLSHTTTGDTIDVMTNTRLHLQCTGDKPMYWLFPNNNPKEPVSKLADTVSKCNDSQSPKCITEVIIPEVNFEMTGHFSCHYNRTRQSEREKSDSIYVYVNDPDHLIVPYEGDSDFIFVAVFQSQPATIPCKPTSSRAKVSLSISHTNYSEEIEVNNKFGVSYDPKKGYHFEYPHWDERNNVLDCSVALDGKEQVALVNIHWSILPGKLNPRIDDSRAMNVSVHSTFTLRCFVHIGLGVIIFMGWDAPNKHSNRVNESMAETERKDLNGNRFDTISRNLTITEAQPQDGGIYQCNVTDANGRVFTASKEITVYENGLPTSYFKFSIDFNNSEPLIRKAGEMVRFVVNVHPFPDFDSVQLFWLKNDVLIEKTDNHYITGVETDGQYPQTYLWVQNITTEDSGTYMLLGNTSHMSANITMRLLVSGSPTVNIVNKEIIILIVLVGIVMIFIAIFTGIKIRQRRKQKRELEFNSHNMFKTGQIELFNPDMPLDEQSVLLPYDYRYEFPKERLKLGPTLGQGAFGRVVKAEAIGLEDGETSTTVAVKMLKERADRNQRKALMAELKILIHLGRHLNIVNLLGAVTKKLFLGELLVIVEYCKFGNLRHYLLANRDSFVNQLNAQTGLIDPNIHTIQDKKKTSKHYIFDDVYDEVLANDITNTNYTNSRIASTSVNKEAVLYADIMHNQQSGSHTDGYIASVDISINSGEGFRPAKGTGGFGGESVQERNNDKVVTTCDLLSFAFQCARGMQYLANRKLIHRDLAARNVLLAENNIVKICDFGLAKDVYKYDNYVKKTDGPLPIRWMAIESIRDKVFTSKSDVWSFGILMHEIFTLGGNPYPGIEIDKEFYKLLKSGYRMERPDLAPNEIYELMKQCWNAEPKERPDFMQIADIIGALMESNVRQHYLDLNDPYQQMNEQILNNNDYLQMSSTLTSPRNEINGDYLQMESEKQKTESKSDSMKCYDNSEHIQPIDDSNQLPTEPMQIVPMIQKE